MKIIVYRGSYTRDHFIINLLNEPLASSINLIWKDHECKILFIIWPFKGNFIAFKVYFHENLHCCNGRCHDLFVPAESVIEHVVITLFMTWCYPLIITVTSCDKCNLHGAVHYKGFILYSIPYFRSWHHFLFLDNIEKKSRKTILEYFWKYYGKWSICSNRANASFSIIFSNTWYLKRVNGVLWSKG